MKKEKIENWKNIRAFLLENKNNKEIEKTKILKLNRIISKR